MKPIFVILTLTLFACNIKAEELKTIQLNRPSKTKGMDIMEAFQNRQSYRSYESKELSLQDLSDVLWAANGINRPESGKRTAPSAINAQDIDVYLCKADGAYLYDAKANCIKQICAQDIRAFMEGRRPSTGAPIILLLVADVSKYNGYKDGDEVTNKGLITMSTLDAGIVSQNISLFCAGAGLGTVPRASLDQEAVRKALNLKKSQTAYLNHPVGYPKK